MGGPDLALRCILVVPCAKSDELYGGGGRRRARLDCHERCSGAGDVEDVDERRIRRRQSDSFATAEVLLKTWKDKCMSKYLVDSSGFLLT